MTRKSCSVVTVSSNISVSQKQRSVSAAFIKYKVGKTAFSKAISVNTMFSKYVQF